MAVRLSGLARPWGLPNPNKCSPLPGLRTFDACLSLNQEVRTLQMPKLRVTTLFLDIKAGFDNVNARTPRSFLLAKTSLPT